MTIGPPRVGKTTLRHLLLDLQPPEFITSTPLMKTAETVSIVSSECLKEVEDTATCSSGEMAQTAHLGKQSVKSDMVQVGSVKGANIPWLIVSEASGIQSLLRFLQQHAERAATQVKPTKKVRETATTDDVPSPVRESKRSGKVTVAFVEDTESTPAHHEQRASKPRDLLDVAATISRIYQLLQRADITDVELPDCSLLQFLDCGGQLAYHDILPVFTTIPAVYLHVFNLNEDLQNRPCDQICFVGGEMYTTARSPLTVAEMMSRSVMTINSLIDKNMQLPKSVLQSEPPEPRVVLVGTHLDKLATRCKGAIKPELDSVNMALNNALDSPSLCLKQMLLRNQEPVLPAMFFPVGRLSPTQGKENKSSQITRHSIFKLKQKIEKLVSAVKVKVPVKWYLHQILEVSCSKEERKPVHMYSDLFQSCLREQAVGDLGEFHVMVTYFHALGLLIHLCGEDVPHSEMSTCLVFTDPSYLFENITKLYQAQFLEEDRCEGSLQPLMCQGKLTKKALRALNVDNTFLSDDDFMNLLVQLYIGADITEKEHDGEKQGRVLFVPSVIPISDAASQHTDLSRPSCQYFIITFEGKFFIPCGVFTGTIARLQSEPRWNLLYKSVSRLHAKFTIGAHDTVYVIDNSMHIKVVADVHSQYNAEECRDFVIDSVAQSYCFLFHGTRTKSPHCGVCQKKPFLVLGLLCRCAACEAKGATSIASLHTDEGIPQTVRCQLSGDVEKLDGSQPSLFWNIKHHVSTHKCKL